MKRTQYSKTLKQTFLAVPAAALMLGVSQAQTTVGINFQAWYYDSGTTPQTIGYGGGYQTTGFPVTAPAFGVDTVNWFNTDPLPAASPVSTTITNGTLILNVSAHDAWFSGIGEQNIGFQVTPALPETVAPGNNEVTWGYLDDGGGGGTGTVPSVSVSGLAAKFPNGYVIETIAAEANVAKFATVNITDGLTTNTLSYSTYYVTNPINDGYDFGGTIGVSASSGTFNSDTIYINCNTNSGGTRSTLAGFIITDQPVISQPVVALTNYNGQTLVLNSGAFGVAPINYQWLFNGTPIPGATTAIYTNSLVTFTNAGSYSVIASNPYGSASNTVATLAIIPLTMQMTNGNVIQDTKPVGTPYDGYNHGTTWLASSTDYNDSLTNYGVEQFIATNNTQITIPAGPDLNSTNGTICFWINYLIPGNLPGKGSEGAMLFDRRLVNTNGAVIVLSKSGGIEVQSTGGVNFTGNISVVDGYWHQVTVTYGQTTNDAESLYIDGVLDTSAANTGTWAWPTNQEIELGLSHDPYWYAYDGQIDDFRIYNRILTADEITTVATPATSSDLIDTNALQLRFSFDNDSASFGTSLVWPYGNLVSSPVLGAGAVWTPLPGATSPFPFVTSPAVSAAFYRIMNAP